MQKDIDKMLDVLKEKYPETNFTLTGTLAMMMRASVFVSESTGGSLMFAVLIISIVLLLVFGSLKMGLIAIIPNLIPSVLSYSILGWFNIPLDMNTLLIGPIIIGIAVDDTIHLLSHYRDEVAIDGNIRRALNASIKEVGQAVVFTSLVLGLGFGIIALGTGPVAITGIIGALAIFLAVFCDLLLLPAMILIFKPTFQKKVDFNQKNKTR
jgi:predicted RND superfamily exporter protein